MAWNSRGVGHSPFPEVTRGYHFRMRLNNHRPGGKPRFVIRDEAADCYDLRLEIDGVLASWTVPKDRRIARRAGDHPLEQAASDVVVLDRGTYANVTDYDMTECLERGHLSFRLRGELMRSCFTLTRIREGDDETWLLIRRRDADGTDELS